MANELPRELMESCCAAAQEATMQGFDDSVLSAVFGDPKHRRLLELVYRMGFESGWRIHEQQIAHGVRAVDGPEQGVAVETLRQHWLRAMECDHDTGRDKPHCACSRVDLGWHPSVGAAVEAWLAHVSGVGGTDGSR